MISEGVVVLGAGGHSKVAISTLQAAGIHAQAVLDDDPQKWNTEILGVKILGPIDTESLRDFSCGVIAIGENPIRKEVANRIQLRWITVVHPAAYVHSSVRLGPGTIVFAGAIIQPGTEIGEHVIVNTGATIDHDCSIADFAHVCPGVHLAGGVTVGEGTLLGICSCAIPRIRIGSWSLVGAGSAVVRDLPDGVVAAGIPARTLRAK